MLGQAVEGLQVGRRLHEVELAAGVRYQRAGIGKGVEPAGAAAQQVGAGFQLGGGQRLAQPQLVQRVAGGRVAPSGGQRARVAAGALLREVFLARRLGRPHDVQNVVHNLEGPP